MLIIKSAHQLGRAGVRIGKSDFWSWPRSEPTPEGVLVMETTDINLHVRIHDAELIKFKRVMWRSHNRPQVVKLEEQYSLLRVENVYLGRFIQLAEEEELRYKIL